MKTTNFNLIVNDEPQSEILTLKREIACLKLELALNRKYTTSVVSFVVYDPAADDAGLDDDLIYNHIDDLQELCEYVSGRDDVSIALYDDDWNCIEDYLSPDAIIEIINGLQIN